MATVGLRTTLRPLENRARTIRAALGLRSILAVAIALSATAIGCATYPGSQVAATSADGGMAPLYTPQLSPPLSPQLSPPAAGAPTESPAAIAPPAAMAVPAPGAAYAAGSPAPPLAARPAIGPQPIVAALASPPGVQLSPGVVVAPLNANVIMVAGVYDPQRQLMPFQRIDWSLATGSVGQIITVGDAPNSSLQDLASRRPTMLSPTHAIGQTFGQNVVITRGTASARDDLTILRGQTWIGLTSGVEGDTVVTALSPEIADPATRQQAAVVHWVDVRWTKPPATVAMPGTHVRLTTHVMRQTSGAPIAGWLVRYTIAGGMPAVFSGGAADIEIATDARGEASAELVQPTPAAGANAITVRLARPASPAGERLEIGAGTTQVTWTTAAIAAPSGPVPAAVVPGPFPSVVYPPAAQQPPPLTVPPFAGTAAPPFAGTAAPPFAATVAPPLGLSALPNEPPAVSRPIVIPPAYNPPANASLGASASSATAPRPTIEMQFAGPTLTFVGGKVTFDLTLSNISNVPATGLKLVDRFDDGLVHPAGHNPLQKELEPIGPHETRRLAITFQVTKSGRLCNLVELSGDGALHASAEACVQSEAVQLSPTPITPKPASPPNPAPPIPTPPQQPNPAANVPTVPPNPHESTNARAELKLLIAARANPIRTGGETSYQIVVSNEGSEPEPNVAVAVTIPSTMKFVGDQSQNPSPAMVSGQTVRFDAIKQLRPRESLVFDVRVRAEREGKAIVQAEVASANSRRPVDAETTTTVFSERN